MGLAASQARLLYLTAARGELELTGQNINQSRLQLSNITNQLFTLIQSLEPGSDEALRLQVRAAALFQVDKALELQLRRIDSQREAMMAEMDAVQKVIAKNIESTFKTFA